MAVYTEISDVELIEYLKQYDIGELHSLKGIAEGVENSNYLLSTDAGMHILTLYEKRVNVDDLPFFLGLMEHLAKNGLECPQPITLNSGEQLSKLAGRPSAIISYLDGNSVKRQMHLAGEGFAIERPNALTVENWRPLYEMSEKGSNSVASRRSLSR